MSQDCMNVSKYLAQAQTAVACTTHMLSKVSKGTMNAALVDLRGGLISGGGVLANTPIDKYKNSALKEKFQKVARSISNVDKALKKEKAFTPELAAIYVKKLDKVHTKISDLWNDVRDQVCDKK